MWFDLLDCLLYCACSLHPFTSHVTAGEEMGADEGFDLVPALNSSPADQKLWDSFLEKIRKKYKGDPNVVDNAEERCIEFRQSEWPMLEYEGYRFRRFSSKVTGYYIGSVERYLEEG